MFTPELRRRLRRRPLGRYRYVRLRWRLLFAAVDGLGWLTFGAVWGMRRLAARLLGRRDSPRQETSDPRAILVIQLDHLGDAVISTVIFPALRKRYPRALIEVLAAPWNRELFEAISEVDRVHVCRASRFARSGRVGWIAATLWWGFRLRRRHFDLGIDVRGEFPHAVMLWLAGARRRLGWAGGGGGFLLTDAAEFVPDRPEVESRLALLGELGILPGAWGEPPRPEFRPSDAARRTVAGWFQKIEDQKPLWQNGGGRQKSPRPRIALHVGAGTPAKRWPVEHWRRLAARLVEKHDAQVVLLGDASDRGTARAITGPRPDPRMADWTGRLGLDELAAALEQVEVLVGADSGPAHLAAAVGTAVVVLFSGTNNPQQWQPRGENVRVLLHPVECSPCHRRQCAWRHHPCMRNLTPEAVVEGVESSLSECCSTVREAEPPVSVFPGGAWEQRDAASSAE